MAQAVVASLGFDEKQIDTGRLLDKRQQRVQVQALQAMVHFFTAVTQAHAAGVLVLEDLHWADEGSFAWLDYLIQACQDVPLLILATARPSELTQRPFWRFLAPEQERPNFHQMKLEPLSAIDSRHLLTEMLADVPTFPLRLSDQIVSGSDGVPLHLEEIVYFLRQEGVIEQQSGSRSVVRHELLTDFPGAINLRNIVSQQWQELSEKDQEILQRAAVLGASFPASGLVKLDLADESEQTTETVTAVLNKLELDGWLYRRQSRIGSLVQVFSFRDELMRQIIYEQIPAGQRQQYHLRAATWLVTDDYWQSLPYAGLVAHHLELAQQRDEAASWYGRSAEQARLQPAPETAVLQYRRALALLPEKLKTAATRLSMYEGLANVLAWLGQYPDALDAFSQAEAISLQLGNPAMQMRLLMEQFWVLYVQERYDEALAQAKKVTAYAEASNDSERLIWAWVAQGRCLAMLGQQNELVALGKEAYEASKVGERQRSLALSHSLLGLIGLEAGHYEQAEQATQRALKLFQTLDDRAWTGLMLMQLGEIAQQQQAWETAVKRYDACLEYAQYGRDFWLSVTSLRALSVLAQRQGQYEQAEARLKRAHLLVGRANSPIQQAWVVNDLGWLYLVEAVATPQSILDVSKKESFQQMAFSWLGQALKLARQAGYAWVLCQAAAGLALLFLEDHLLDEAEAQALEAVITAQAALKQNTGRKAKERTAVAWRVLGNVLGKVPQKEKEVRIGQESVTAVACYQHSMSLLEEVGVPTRWQQLHTLHAWYTYEEHRENHERAAVLHKRLTKLLKQLNVDPATMQIEEPVV